MVAEVLAATMTELARVGYGGLRIEEIAEAAGVAKTTIYRRWPAKSDLVAAALRMSKQASAVPQTGSIEHDLFLLCEEVAAHADSAEGRSVARVLAAEIDDPEVSAIIRGLRAELLTPWLTVVERAVADNLLPRSVDPVLIVEILWGTIMARVRRREPVERAWLQTLVALVVRGAGG